MCENINEREQEVETKVKLQSETLKEIERRSSEIDKLIYKWKVDKVCSYKQEEVKDAVEELQKNWLALNKIANRNQRNFQRSLEAGVSILN